MNEHLSSVQKILSHTAVTIGAPVTGGTIGIYSLVEQMVPFLTIASLFAGIILGILSYIWKRKLYKLQMEETRERIKALQNG